jgi:hypothetical protein
MAREKRTKEELRKASDHLQYEVKMLNDTMIALATGVTGNSTLNNALIESFTVHTRALIYFLYPTNAQPGDVLAEDYFDEGKWRSIRPDEPEIFPRIKRRVNKEVAHLTYDRQSVKPELKGWNFISIGNTIMEIVKVFLTTVSPELLGERWEHTKQAAQDSTDSMLLQVHFTPFTNVSTPG